MLEGAIADLDPAAGTLTCPAGVTKTITKARKAVFGLACRACPLRQRCTTAAKGRTIQLHEHDLLQRRHRQRASEDGFQGPYRQHRPMVERSIAWLTRGNRRLRYRGVTKNNNWLHNRAAAINLRRLLTLGLTHSPTGWAIA